MVQLFKRTVAFLLVLGGVALADQVLRDNQNGGSHTSYNFASYQATNLAGGGTQCVQADNTGKMLPAGAPCGGGGGAVSSVTGTAQHISATPTTGAVVVDTIGGLSTGALSGGNINLGAGSNGTLQQTVVAGVAAVTEFNGTANSIPYYIASGQLGQDNANFSWNDSTDVLTVGGTILVGQGSAGTPSLNFAGTSGTGIWYLPAISSIAFNFGGSRKADLTSSTFYLEDNAATLAIGPSNDTLLARNASNGVSSLTSIYGIAFGTAAKATTDTIGFVQLPTMAGVPTGSVTNVNTGQQPTIIDSTHERLYVNEGAANWYPWAQDTHSLATGLLKNTTSTGVWSIGAAGSDFAPVGSCSANQFATATNAASLTCAQPAFSNLSGSATCAQMPALAGVVTTPGGSCATSYAGLPAATDVMVSAGPTSTPVGDSLYTYDTTNHLQQAGSAISVNGAGIASNVSVVVGTTNSANRDRVLLFCGGGALGATGTSDNTFVDVLPAATAIRTGVTAGIYATERIHSLNYTSQSGTVSPSEEASLYIDGAPTTGGGVGGGGQWAIHVASGVALFGSAIEGGQLTAGGALAAEATTGRIAIAGTGGVAAAVSAEQDYYINVGGSTLVTGGAVWLATSSTAGQGGTALEYVHAFAATNVALNVRITTNAITSGTLAIQITRNGSSFSTITLNNVSSGTLSTGTVSVGSPSASDRWGVLASGTGTGMSGNMVFTATLLLAPNVF